MFAGGFFCFSVISNCKDVTVSLFCPLGGTSEYPDTHDTHLLERRTTKGVVFFGLDEFLAAKWYNLASVGVGAVASHTVATFNVVMIISHQRRIFCFFKLHRKEKQFISFS